jgi:hypothetical protein
MIYLLLATVPFVLWALADMYVCYRLVRKPEVDSTAGVTWYWALKWSFASQTKTMVKKLPWMSQDLTEALGIRPDDGKVT